MTRFPIRWKLSVSAAALVAVVAVVFAWVGERALSSIYEDREERLIQDEKSGQIRQSKMVASHIGVAAREALAGSEARRLTRIVKGMVGPDSGISYAIIADDKGLVIAHSDMESEQALEAGMIIDAPSVTSVSTLQASEERIRLLTHPIEDVGHGRLGVLQIGWSLRQLDDRLAAISREKERNIHEARVMVLFAGILAIIAGILGGWVGGSALSEPIQKLAFSAKRFSEGDFTVRSSIRSGDEIGVLGDTMDNMAAQIGDLIEETQIRAELEHELAVARRIQEALLPSRDVIERPGIEFCGMVQSASQCGGDWWAFSELTRRRTLILVGDVTGHGVSSAMLTATAKSCLQTMNMLTRGDLRVGELLKVLDQVLRAGGRDEFYMSCFVAVADPVEATLTYANAGHNPPFLLRQSEEGWRHGRLRARGNRLGDADGYSFVEHTIQTQPGDFLCWYTDGLTEGQGPDGREYGVRRLRQSLERVAGNGLSEGLDEIIGDFNTYRQDVPINDDITCVVGRVTA
jgi:serine phosphatase RsbU (regulator of sigma subunit)